jgi:hypothetical protein
MLYNHANATFGNEVYADDWTWFRDHAPRYQAELKRAREANRRHARRECRMPIAAIATFIFQ